MAVLNADQITEWLSGSGLNVYHRGAQYVFPVAAKSVSLSYVYKAEFDDPFVIEWGNDLLYAKEDFDSALIQAKRAG